MLRDQVFIAVFFVMPPGLFTLAAIVWMARLTEGQLVSAVFAYSVGAVVLGMGLTVIGAFVAVGRIRGGEGE
ncbi:hypothetical protein ACBQ16_14150 [Halopseudomonas bauzanensis]|uniref:hypothetical protein n=1 Tax=Halopseudomonas bauzanensis TaxID=653930 RepID=UPI0035268E7F